MDCEEHGSSRKERKRFLGRASLSSELPKISLSAALKMKIEKNNTQKNKY